MKGHGIAISLAVINAALLVCLIASQISSHAATQPELSVLRGCGLEIVDDNGRVRASILVHGPETVKGKEYPGAVVLRMGDPNGPPAVKLAASEKGGGLGLSGAQNLADGRPVGIQLHADDPVLLLIDHQGHERSLTP